MPQEVQNVILDFVKNHYYLSALIVFAAIALFIKLKKKATTRKWRYENLKTAGDDFEKEALKVLKSIPEIKKTYHDVYLHNGNGIQQIDLIGVSNKAVYVVECKDYECMVNVMNSKNWVHVLSSGDTKEFYSPALQNEGHIKFMLDLGRETFKGIPIVNVVVFSNDTTIQFRSQVPSAAICNLRALKRIIKQYDAKFSTTIDTYKVAKFLKPYTHVSLTVKEDQLAQAHVAEYIRTREANHWEDLR